MSGFEKTLQSGLVDFNDPMRALHGDVYGPYAQSPYVTQLFPSPLEDQPSPDTDSLHYMPTQNYAAPVSLEEPGSPGLQPPPRQAPEVTSYSPQRGSEGSKIFVHVLSQHDLHSSARAAFLSFGSKQCECTTNLLGYQDSTFNYVFSVEAPAFITTMSPSFAVPLQLVIDIPSDNGPVILQVGVFTYEQFPQASSSDECRKRRVSVSEDSGSRPIKRHSAQEIEVKGERDCYTIHERSASYSPFLQTPTTVSTYPAQCNQEKSPRASFDLFAGTSSGSQTSLQAPSPLPASWSPSFSAAHSLPAIAAPQQTPTLSARPPNPTLIRTSTMQQQPNHLGQAQPFNPYAMYPTKAVLKLNGDLDSMSEDWTAEEKEAKRRLVQFTRVQEGSTIHADFKAVSPEDRAPNSICISCIYWESKNECFVTSVDTIYLLESLVGVRFTVEEKNRIRRNLEGFRPLTVSKAKADSEEFFKVIMGFPAPKPRNIEKDVKVFPWKILSHALKKIIGKYSASYSSTAGALPTSLNGSISHTRAGSDAGTESQRASSPQSVPESTTSYTASLTTTAFSPPIVQSKPALGGCVSGPELAATMAGVSQAYAPMPATYSYQTSCQLNQQMLTTGPSWDFSALANTPATAMVSANPENFDYLSTIPYSIGSATPGV
ncbi:hypothetical protein VTN77DRAFT_5613 [Rasamsonia byssochlamydoides]|uniref:uncharacterized protein n=1 Tax=Rasamsonia byssochlamydoides TaxID=89139 RepID=UPI003743C9F9